MKFMYFSIKYLDSDILLENINSIYNRLVCCNQSCYCVGMVSVTSASRYITSASRYQSRLSIYIGGLIQRNSMELAEAVPIACVHGRCRMHVWNFLTKYINLHITTEPSQ